MQIEHAVVCMLCDAMQYEDTSKNPYQKVEKGSCWRLGYKEGDQISFIQTRRYMTVFSWLKEHSLDPKSVDVSAQVLVQTIFNDMLLVCRTIACNNNFVFWSTAVILVMRNLSVLEMSSTSMPAFSESPGL
jgi:hypothetical protein